MADNRVKDLAAKNVEVPTPDAAPLGKRLLYYINPIDARYEDLARGDWRFNVLRDFTAGLVVAMVKPAEVREVLTHNGFHIALMLYTAVMVVLTDFLTGVLSAVIIWVVLTRFFDKPAVAPEAAMEAR